MRNQHRPICLYRYGSDTRGLERVGKRVHCRLTYENGFRAAAAIGLLLSCSARGTVSAAVVNTVKEPNGPERLQGRQLLTSSKRDVAPSCDHADPDQQGQRGNDLGQVRGLDARTPLVHVDKDTEPEPQRVQS